MSWLILTLLRPMEFSITLYTDTSGWSIVYIEGSQVIILKKCSTSFSEDQFCLSKQCRPALCFGIYIKVWDYKTFFMLNSAEHKIYHAHKC